MFINFSKTPPKKAFPVQTSEGVIKKILVRGLIFDCFRCLPSERKIYLQIGGAKCLSLFKQVKGVFTMPRLSKKAKQEWNFFINPETARRTYNSLCLKCKNKCKQSHKAIVVFCPKYKSKRGAKSVKNRREYDDSG